MVAVVDEEAENVDDKEIPEGNEMENTPPIDPRLQYRISEYGIKELRKYDVPIECEKLISLSSFYEKSIDKGVQDDESSVSATLQFVRTQLTVIDIMFHQSPAAVLMQAVYAIAGAHPFLSRLPPSLAPVHVELPQDILSQPRGEQMRWLLYSDFSPFVQPLGPNPNRLLPPTEARKLSLFRNHCPVALSMGEYTIGFPEFQAILAGRVYMMVSKPALDQFMKHPLTYIRPLVHNGIVKRPSKELPKRIWLIKPATSWDAEGAISALAGQLQLDVLDPLTVLRDQQLDSLHTVVLRQGLIMSEAMVTQLVLDETMARSNGFLVHDLPLNRATVDAIEKNNVTLDIILVLDSDASQAAKVVDTIDQLGISFPVVSVVIVSNTSPTEIVAAILRAINPLDINRIDGAEEGVVDGSPLSSIEEESRNTFGATGIYCPVTFANTNLMHRVIPGKAEFSSFFGHKTYRFAGSTEKMAFDRNPISYIPSQPTTLFRPVVFLLGITSSGRQTLAANLIDSLADEKVTTLDLDEVHRDYEQLITLEKYKLSLDELDESTQSTLYCFALSKAFDHQEKNSSSLFLITGLSTAASRLPSIELMQQCIERKWFPFLVIPLKIDEDTAVKRRMMNWKYTPPPSEPDEAEADGEPENASAKRQRLQAEEVAARDEEVQRIITEVAGELEAYASLFLFFNEQHIQVVPEINATCGPQRVLKEALISLDSLCLTRRHQLFCTVEQRLIERLNQLIHAGYITIGKHGPYCPVDTSRIPVPELPEAVVYRDRLYSVNAQHVAKFTRTPSAFVALSTKPNRSFISIAIVGPPKSGKTQLAKSLASMYQLIYLSIDDILGWIVHCQLGADLYKFVHEYITCKEPLTFERSLIPDSILLQCIVTRMRAYDVQIYGYVLDGFPENSSQATLWEGMQKSEVSMPMSIICLEASVTDIIQRTKLESTSQFLKCMSQWQMHRLRLYLLWIQTYGCGYLKLLNTHQKSEWKVVAEAAALVEPIAVSTDIYFQRLASGLAASMAQLRFSQGYIETHGNIRLGSVCPVVFSTTNEQKTSLTFDRRFLTEFEYVNYWLADESAYQLFLENPGNYLEAKTLLLSGKTAIDMAIGSSLTTGTAMRLAFQGYCPVTYYDGSGPSDWSSIRKGSKFIIAAYDNMVFAFTSVGAKIRFLRAPQKFASLELPVKLPPLIDESHRQINVTLPGRLEQAHSKVTEEALLALGQERFKYPGISIRASAIQFVALFLKAKKKASNQSSQLPRDVAAMLQNYVSDCHLGSDIKELSVPVGSAIKGIRTVRGKEVTDLSAKVARFDMIVNSPRAFFNAYTIQGLEK
ncbi:hypothetical protein THRCLA_21914 [Thraustotheca clavata]|uniref:Uncharacterized protein n=1 Tax=Thraustotheca clavata TaxID=74557 RepID=A0A1V9ZIY0_9STRA|nr:hypothetical protein THRCLA_21914 [Thraustotheca clavata]